MQKQAQTRRNQPKQTKGKSKDTPEESVPETINLTSSKNETTTNKEAGPPTSGTKGPEGHAVTAAMESPTNSKSKAPTSEGPNLSEEIEDLLWEKEQLHEINLRVENIFTVFGTKMSQKSDKADNLSQGADEFRERNNKAIKDLADAFLSKEEKKNKELADAKAEIRLLQEKTAEMNVDMKELHSKNENLKKDFAKLKSERDQSLRDKDKALADVQNIKDTYEVQLQTLEGQNQKLYDENKRLTSTFDEAELKREQAFAAKLAEKLQEHDDQFHKLKNETDDVYRKQMKDIQNSYDKQLEGLGNTIEEQKKELADLQGDLLKTVQDRDRIKKELEFERPLRELLENELKKQKEQAKDEIKRAKDNADDAQKNYRQLRDEHFTLQKTNLDLRVEIESLKKKLDTFEEQHKIQSPVRPTKRRRTDSSLLNPKTLKSVQGPIIGSRSIFPLECVTQQLEGGDWVGFELQNQWNEPIVIKGWFLSAGDRSPQLPLPEKKLNPKELIRITLTDKKKEPSDLVWKGLKLKKNEQFDLWAEDNLGLRHKIDTIVAPFTST